MGENCKEVYAKCKTARLWLWGTPQSGIRDPKLVPSEITVQTSQLEIPGEHSGCMLVKEVACGSDFAVWLGKDGQVIDARSDIVKNSQEDFEHPRSFPTCLFPNRRIARISAGGCWSGMFHVMGPHNLGSSDDQL